MLKTSTAQELRIPPLLYDYLLKGEKVQAGGSAPLPENPAEEASSDSDETSDASGPSEEGQEQALGLAYQSYCRQEAEQTIFYLAVFAKNEALRLENLGNPVEGLELLSDAITLEYQGLEIAHPHQARKLIDQLSELTELAYQLLAELGALSGLARVRARAAGLFDISATIWEPNLKEAFRSLKEFLDPLCQMARLDTLQKRSLSRTLIFGLMDFKIRLNETEKNRAVNRGHLGLVVIVTENWIQMVQQEILLAASVEYGSEGIDVPIVARQVQQLIGQVEKRLRTLIQKKYQQQYGDGWVEHIANKHKNSYNYWLNNMSKDQSTFQNYNQYSPQILEYASTDDLRELVTAQWHLFRPIFEFGYNDRNKAVFYDKMSQIIRVRNPLAHNRSIPENELLRARVLCTDILLALDQAGEG